MAESAELPPGMVEATMIANSDHVLRKLDYGRRFTPEEQEVLRRLPVQIASFRAGHHLVREGDRPKRCFVLLDGFICASKHLGEGRRQIASFYVPGDIPDLQSLHLKVMDIAFDTVTPCTVALVAHEALQNLCNEHPRLASALWRATLVDAAIYREWVATVGQRSADARLAHLFCELFLRLNAVGLTEQNSCEWPMTQAELGDAAGISVVHANRTLQKLRADKLIQLSNKRLTILDWDRLCAVADFDATYLHLDD